MNQTNPRYMLQYIDALLKHNNFTKAAKDLYISQPYLTQTIQKIEKELNTEIINRKSSHFQLTDAGKIYYQYLETIEEEEETFKRELTKHTNTSDPVIRLGILSSLATYVLPLTLPLFMEKFPKTPIVINEDLPKNNELGTINHELDFYIGQNSETVASSLITKGSGSQAYYAVIPPTSSLYQPDNTILNKGSFTIDQLLKENLILTTSGSAIRRQVDRLLQRHKVTPKIVLESSNIYTVMELAKNDIGVAFVPEGLIKPSRHHAYNLYAIARDLISVDYFVAYSASKTLTTAEQAFVEIFTENLQIYTSY